MGKKRINQLDVESDWLKKLYTFSIRFEENIK